MALSFSFSQVGSVSTCLRDMTGNQAEYCALIIGLEVCTAPAADKVLPVSFKWGESQYVICVATPRLPMMLE